jgi:pimeloyl-ACP methyl ester carboxylesterase
MTTEFVDLEWSGVKGVAPGPVRIEYQWLAADRTAQPLLIFLHEGLGSVAMWRDFPQRLCAALDCRGLAYSRPGYGRSTPRPADERWGPDFLQRQAHELLPALLRELDIDAFANKPWLFGHSDGGSIALSYAARFPDSLAGAVVLAPHILVEPISIASIAQAREAYRSGGLRQALAKYHDDPDSAFWGWNDAWLNPAFGSWSMVDELPSITCPVLAIQGVDDEYGTLEQIRGIARLVSNAKILELSNCGHSPHRDQPHAVIDALRECLDA